MSNSKKKHYKKRKPQTNNTKNVSKAAKIVNDWLWLIALAVITAAVVLLMVFVPMCDEACSTCDACQVSESDLIKPATKIEKLDQFKLPEEGEEIVVFETSMGNIKFRLFPEYAPKAVENFTTLVKQGYYDGLTFFRIGADFMIQSGDPKNDGTGGESIWGEDFEDEYGTGLHNYCGALSMANSGKDTNGSQFFIVVADEADFNKSFDAATLRFYGVPDEVISVYQQVGGTWWLDGDYRSATGNGHTVFGQVFEGLEVAVNISEAEVVSGSDAPVEPVTINKAYVTTYSSEE